ncbi:hypothetical protein Bbelb_430190 [Branchiostoma belcheri]|nr:hypothetical protein Bbelb_430190 [Branchiostoma belcheri]
MAGRGVVLTSKNLRPIADLTRGMTIQFEDFVVILSSILKAEADVCLPEDEEGELREAFKLFDKEGNGYITSSDLRQVLNCLGQDLSEEEDWARHPDASVWASRDCRCHSQKGGNTSCKEAKGPPRHAPFSWEGRHVTSQWLSSGHNPPYVLLRAVYVKNVGKCRASVRGDYHLRTESYGFGRHAVALQVHVKPAVCGFTTRACEYGRRACPVRTRSYDARKRSRPDVACRPHPYTLRNCASDVRVTCVDATPSPLDDMIGEVDQDGDGKIDYDALKYPQKHGLKRTQTNHTDCLKRRLHVLAIREE